MRFISLTGIPILDIVGADSEEMGYSPGFGEGRLALAGFVHGDAGWTDFGSGA